MYAHSVYKLAVGVLGIAVGNYQRRRCRMIQLWTLRFVIFDIKSVLGDKRKMSVVCIFLCYIVQKSRRTQHHAFLRSIKHRQLFYLTLNAERMRKPLSAHNASNTLSESIEHLLTYYFIHFVHSCKDRFYQYILLLFRKACRPCTFPQLSYCARMRSLPQRREHQAHISLPRIRL